ncbi:hypothetical protein KP509_06G086600 [Ceratopteris richardii]|uniref:F-box domain-containing protein n=1 Tax=Ceratopteris richardii TaxID=49495 RepID=A0A8T2UKL7_CERRI|nr:hypothetical protein KP509_06G086600 [Ceratopteris richardii]KAH7435973.1 hypothetical protein KP509_06G086600 [Ceratopteris richardii]
MEISAHPFEKKEGTGPGVKPDHHHDHHKDEEEHHFYHHHHHHHHHDVEEALWADMLPDALAKIFSRLSLEDMLCSIPRVCRSWRRASHDAVCWQKVDLDEWSRGRKPETLERMLVFLMSRSRGCLREICAPNLNNDNMLRIIAWSGSPLRVLRIQQSIVTEDCICQLAPHFAFVNYIDVSGCSITKASVESFGKHCPMITRLNLNMYPQSSTLAVCDDMAYAIAQYMPQLKHLEMAYGLLSNAGLKAVLEKCTALEHLDLRGCWQLNVEESFVKEARKRFKVFHPPIVENDIYSTDSDLDASDFYDDSDYYDEDMWYDSEFEDLDDLVMEMHEEEINGTLYFWPDTSPSR